MIKRIDHLGIATSSVQKASRFYELLGLSIGKPEEVEDQKVRVLCIKTGDSSIELLEPTQADSPIARFLEKRGEGLHHIALEVENLDLILEELKNQNVRLIDHQTKIGVDGKRIAFIHPHSTGGVLVELCEETGELTS